MVSGPDQMPSRNDYPFSKNGIFPLCFLGSEPHLGSRAPLGLEERAERSEAGEGQAADVIDHILCPDPPIECRGGCWCHMRRCWSPVFGKCCGSTLTGRSKRLPRPTRAAAWSAKRRCCATARLPHGGSICPGSLRSICSSSSHSSIRRGSACRRRAVSPKRSACRRRAARRRLASPSPRSRAPCLKSLRKRSIPRFARSPR